MKKMTTAHSGFTLIELMVTITILLVVAGGSISAYLTFNKSQTMDSDAREVVAQLNKVRASAANLVYPTGCDGLTKYTVQSDASLTGMSVTAMCNSGNVVTNVPNMLKASVFSAPVLLNFMAGTGNLMAGADRVITLKNTEDGVTTKSITVSAFGAIYLNYIPAANILADNGFFYYD